MDAVIADIAISLGSQMKTLHDICLLQEKFRMDEDGLPVVDMPYHVRVLVPCYKEDIDILRRTLTAAHEAELPKGCQRTIYLCDDGKDPEKRK